MNAPPWPPGCPWTGFAPPTLQFCEENLCGWIAAPANTWSNLGYVLAGLWLWRTGRADAPALRLFAPVAVLLGLASFAYHASYSFVFQLVDNAAMYAFAGLLLSLNLGRLGLAAGRRLQVFFGLLAASCAAMLAAASLGLPTQAVFGSLLCAVLGSEALLLRRERPAPPRRALYGAAALFAASFVAWTLDALRIVCDPGNHWLQGHALWHLGTAGCLPLLRSYYRGPLPT